MPGLEWDEVPPGISVFIPERYVAEFVRFLDLVIAQDTLELVDVHQPDSLSRWTTASSEAGAFYFDDDDNALIIPISEKTAASLSSEILAGAKESSFGEVRVAIV